MCGFFFFVGVGLYLKNYAIMLQPFLAMLHVYSGCRHSQLLHFILTFKRALQYLGIIVE